MHVYTAKWKKVTMKNLIMGSVYEGIARVSGDHKALVLYIEVVTKSAYELGVHVKFETKDTNWFDGRTMWIIYKGRAKNNIEKFESILKSTAQMLS